MQGLASSPDADPPVSYSLRIGSMAERDQLPPRRQQWCRSALGWSQDISGLPAKPTQ